MSLNPPPVWEKGTAVIVQKLLRSDMSRAAIVTLGVQSPNLPSLADALNIANSFQTHFNARLQPSFDSEVLIEQPTVKLGNGDTTPFEALATGSAVNGGASSAFLPPSVALLVKKTTGVSGKKNRGRWYFPFLLGPGQVSENGTIDPTIVAAFQVAFGNFLNDMTITSGYPVIIVNRVFNTPRPPHYVTNVNGGPSVAAMTVEPIIATQRRRLDR